MVRIALFPFAGPEMPCTLQHGFLFARDAVRRGGEARIVSGGNSPRWLSELVEPSHTAHHRFRTVIKALVAGVCQGCASIHDALDVPRSLGLPLLSGAYGHASLPPFSEAGLYIVTL